MASGYVLMDLMSHIIGVLATSRTKNTQLAIAGSRGAQFASVGMFEAKSVFLQVFILPFIPIFDVCHTKLRL